MTPISPFTGNSTARIVCNNGSIGTGFFFVFDDPNDENFNYPLLVTNKHVIEGADSAMVVINVEHEHDEKLEYLDLKIEHIPKSFIMHPSPDVDLCVFPLASVNNRAAEAGLKLKSFFFGEDNIYKEGQLLPIEDVYMTGYPNGLWDEVNNKPVTRKGITASDINQDWKGKRQFMIDMACFGGSSGSPVYIMNEGSFMHKNGISMGTRLLLLGILFAGPLVTVDGEIEIIEVPTGSVAISKTSMMMNLGIVIKATELMAFKKILGIN